MVLRDRWGRLRGQRAPRSVLAGELELLGLTRQKRARRALAAQPIPSFPQHHEYLGGAMPSVDF